MKIAFLDRDGTINADYPDIDLSKSIMCGDSINDMQCAKTAGLEFYGIGFGTKKINTLSDIHKFI